MTVLRFDDNRGGLDYPFLPNDLQWQIISRPLGDDTAMADIFAANTPTLRWVKDDKVLDLHVPGMDTATFLTRAGLQLSLHKGGYVLSKRLSRVMRPYRYWGFFDEAGVAIEYNDRLDAALWDGCGLVSRAFVQRLADRLNLTDRHRRQLLHTRRFEVTTLHSGGQDKGRWPLRFMCAAACRPNGNGVSPNPGTGSIAARSMSRISLSGSGLRPGWGEACLPGNGTAPGGKGLVGYSGLPAHPPR